MTWMLTKCVGEKAKWELSKNAMSYLEQIFKVTPHKITVVQPLTSHLKNYPSKTNKTCGTPLEKQRQTHKWHSSTSSYTWMCHCWLTSKNLSTLISSDANTGCNLENLLGAMDDRDGWGERVKEIYAVSKSWWWSILVCSYLSIYLLISVFSSLSIYLSLFLSIYLSIYQSQSFPIYLSIYLSLFIPISSSSSCHATSLDIPDPLSPLFPIVHRLWQVFRATSRILK